MSEFVSKKCKPCHADVKPLTQAQIEMNLKAVHGWHCDGKVILRKFEFKNYYETTAFVNAVVWIAHAEDHHAEITFTYKQCEVRYSTHSIAGISENDFICAAKINQLLPA